MTASPPRAASATAPRHLSRRPARTAALLAGALAAGLAACGRGDTAPPVAAHPVVLATVTARDLQDRIEATGELVAKDRAQVAAQVEGQITEILVEEGAAASQGVVVLEIDPQRRRLELESARARLSESTADLANHERSLQRYTTLAKGGAASEAKLDEVQTAVALGRSRAEAARAQLGMAERALHDASVAAPFSGLVAKRMVSRGDYVQQGKPLFELVALDPIEVEFSLPEVDSSRLSGERPVNVRLTPFPDEVFAAKVSMISPTIDPRTRTLRVKAVLPNGDGRLRPGLFARVDLGVAERSGVLMVPEEAVLQRADGAVMFQLTEGNHVARRVVKTGLHKDGEVEIVSGLSAGDRVVARGHATLADGVLVEPRNVDGTGVQVGETAEPARATP